MSRTGRGLRIIAVLLGLGVCTAPGAAGTVYTWVDGQGVRHFSQYPPDDPNQPTKTIQLDPLPAPPEPDERLENIRAIARDLELSRQQREEQRASKAPYASLPPPQPAPVEPSYVLPYLYPYATPYPPAYPPHRPRPYPPDRPGSDRPEHKPSRPGGKFTSPLGQTNP